MPCTVEIISVGNELLIGRTANTNAQWLAKYITSLGGQLRRIVIVGDSLDEISSVLRDALSRGPNIIITTGGLGPTFDDMTLEAIARTLKTPLKINHEALSMIKAKYHRYELNSSEKIDLTPARVKMANLPEGAKPLQNPIGTAPGVLLTEGKSKIIALPGVPTEMEAIFEDSAKSLIKEAAGKIFICEKTLNVTQIMESAIAPLIDEAMHENPHVYIKSHPRASELKPHIELHLMTASKSKSAAEKRLKATVDKISQLVLVHSGKIDIPLPPTPLEKPRKTISQVRNK